MKKLYSLFVICVSTLLFSQNQKSFHDTQGNIEVNGSGQLQFSLPIALPPGVKSVAPQVNLVYTSGSGNGIAGYGWNLSGITAISRVGKNLDKDGENKPIQLTYEDFYSFNGQRLILKSGEYGRDGAEYTTEKYSNVKIKSVGSLSGKNWQGPEYWEVTFEDGSQAWYGVGTEAKTPVEYNITKWKDAQGNYISYEYTQQHNVAVISAIKWGGNETLNKPHFNQIQFNYAQRDLRESSFVAGQKFIQEKILTSVQVNANGSQFKKYVINYDNGSNGTKYQFVKNIIEYNSNNEPANPVTFEYEKSERSIWEQMDFNKGNNKYSVYGDFDGDGRIDMIEYFDENQFCKKSRWGNTEYIDNCTLPKGYRIYSGVFDKNPKKLNLNTDLEPEAFDVSTPIIFKTKNSEVQSKQGIAFLKYLPLDDKGYRVELHIYSVEGQELKFQYHKKLGGLVYDNIKYTRGGFRGGPKEKEKIYWGRLRSSWSDEDIPVDNLTKIITEIHKIEEIDLNGDGISEVLLNERTYRVQGNSSTIVSEKNIIVNMDPMIDQQESVYVLDIKQTDLKGDFDGDGKHDFIRFNDKGQPSILKIDDKYNVREFNFHSEEKMNGLLQKSIVGDFNGDGKNDLMTPIGEGSEEWNIYVSDGNKFISQGKTSIAYYKPQEYKEGENVRGDVERKYLLQDLNKDGKSDFIYFVSKYHYNQDKGESTFLVYYYENIGEDSSGNYIFEDKKIINLDSYIDIVVPSSFFYKGIVDIYDKMFNFNPFVKGIYNHRNKVIFKTLDVPSIAKVSEVGHFHPIVGNFRVNNLDENILILHQNKMVKYSSYDLSKASRIRSITQGGLRTEVEYKELDPNKNPHFYAGVKSEQYPYMELDKVAQSYAVAQLRQEIAPSQFRKQDFRYRGFVTHLQGKGMIGFRQTARSSWYADGFENTKIWSGAEIDPLNEGLPIKEWSIKTNNETEIFPSNLSLNNNQLLSFKETKYKIDHLDGNKVKAIVPTQITTKDFIKNVVSVDNVEYDEYYLPIKTISNTNNGFAEKITTLTYYPPNLTGQGRDYFLGRPRSKTELLKAYGDSKGAKEEYEYENHQLKTLRTYNRDNTGYLQETYAYDGFGNIIEKVISNSIDANIQRSSSRYDDKGRFVIEKTDNLGLITRISYNDWGQVLTQTDPLGNTLTNTYDAWGKHLTATTNLGGTTRLAYEKLANDDAKITEFAPDGGETITYTNKIGQTYKTTTKAFDIKNVSVSYEIDIIDPIEDNPTYPIEDACEDTPFGRHCLRLFSSSNKLDVGLNISGNTNNQTKGKYISKEIRYDVLGRKIGESEPYFEGESASKWNTIEYDEYSRPIKATAFTGKIIKTEYTGNTVNVIETNAHNRFKKQTFDAIGNITFTEDKGGVIHFRYNAAGENIGAKYETNVVTTKYDNWGRKVEFHDPSNGLYRYEYNHGFGLLTKEISPKGEKSYTYNDKGQLISQREVSNDGTSTDKHMTFSYNDKGMLIAKNGTSKGKSFGASIRYDNFGRVLSAEENSYGKKFEKKNIVYDHLNRVKSYEKSLTSSGKTTKAIIEHIYDERSGALYQIKDKTKDKVLWELKEHNAKGQVTQAKLGATTINNTYDANGFLSFINHSVHNKPTILNISYSFDAIKNELNSRNTGGAFNIIENFVYDDNNRLINWTNPRTGALHFNKYDKQGRIVENDQLGKVKFGNTQKVYQPTSVELNAKGEETLKNNLIQSIGYNENNDPTFINGVKGDVRFEYGLTEMRQMVSFGGEFLSSNPNIDGASQGKYTRYYSEDGSYEITVDNRTGKEKHILYIGGNPYESEIIFVKNYDEAEGSYKFLHKDYLGSILAISDELGNKLEQRHYDAWGNLTHLQIGNGEIITDDKIIHNSSLIIDRGYTSHEHFFEVGIIHMNGRLYDPMLRRFLNADENIQDPHNTQNYNKYGYVFNNPLMYNDPNGEFVFAIFAALPAFWGAVATGAVIGAAVGLASYTIGLAVTGNLHQWKLGGALKATFFGAVGGAVSAGLGELFQSAKVVAALGKAKFVVQAAAHGISQGVLSVMQGGDFISGLVGGFFGSLGAEAWGGAMKGLGYEKFAGSTMGMVSFGALSGGIGAELSGGNFWQGAVTGGIVAGLNHAMHKMETNTSPPGKSLLERAKEFTVDYFDYNGNGKIDGWEYGVGVLDVGITVVDIVTVPSGEGVAAHMALKGGVRAIGKSQIKTTTTKKASSSVGKIVSNTTAKKGNAIQLTFEENISASQMYKLMNPKAINLDKSGGFISPNGIKWQYYKGGTTNPTGWTIKGVTPNKQTIIMRFSK